jgi:exosortase A-associated hydrolase 2
MPHLGELQPFYLDGPRGALFAVWQRPAGGAGKTVLYLPPLAEEMNRSRRTIAALGRTMAERGLGLFVLDLFGTGDSAGAFEEATWAGWLADAAAAVRFIRADGHGIAGVMGLRTGALLALATACEQRLERVMLCQPIESGRAYLTGLLRSRVAAGQAGDGPRATIAGLRGLIAAGSGIQIMGHALSSTLWDELARLQLAEVGAGFAGRVDWLHLAGGPVGALPQKTADEMSRLAGTIAGKVVSRTIAAPAFWLLEEAPPADRFVAATTDGWLVPAAQEAA